MALELTQRAFQSSQKTEINLNLVLEIDGVDTLYGAVPIRKIIKIGDFEIGQPGIFIGGQLSIGDQESLISFQSGTSSEIRQTLYIDKGKDESISTLRIALIDKSLKATKLITPGEIVEDILGRKIRVWLGLSDTSWKDDYLIIFRGIIDAVDASSGAVVLNLASTENKKRTSTFIKGTTQLTASMTNSQTTANCTSTIDFFSPYLGPNGMLDPDITLAFRIGDEIIKYESVAPTQFGTLTRGYLGTVAAAHSSGDDIESFYIIEGNAIDIALKFLLSGSNGPYVEDIQATNFVRISPTETVSDSIFFQRKDFIQEFNPVIGDYITTTGASNGANNVSLKRIVSVTETDLGVYLTISGVSFVEEITTTGVVDIRSQYDVWGGSAGLGFSNDEVDIAAHLDSQSKYFSSLDYKFYLKDTIEDGKTFLSEQIYNPMSAFSIPRKAQSSMGVHTGPIPGTNIKTITSDNVLNAEKLTIKRNTNENFFNSVIYRFEEDALEDRFKSGYVTLNATSLSRIPIGNKSLVIDSMGLRTTLSGANIATQAAFRRLRKYKFGAEHIKGIETNFKTGFDIEIGDLVILDLESLQITDINTGSRTGDPRLFEVTNKTLSIKTGKINFDIVDTNFSLDVRYGLIGPASFIKTGISTTQFILDPSFNTTKYGSNEYKKWEKYIGAYVVVRNSSYAISDFSYIASLSSNTMTLTSALSFTPSSGYIVELGDYDNQPANVKLIYAFMSNGASNFADGMVPYQMS